jgi:ADP-ribose pyrophosphatase
VDCSAIAGPYSPEVGGARYRVERARVAHENPYFRVIRSAVVRPDGTPADYHTLDFPRPAVAVVLRHRGATLLVRQQRFIVARDVWALPSGGVEDGEDPAEAAARELTEETGYRAGRIEHLLSYHPSYGVSNQVFHCFLAGEPSMVGAPDRNEVEDVAWWDDGELHALIAGGDVPDGLSLTPLLYLAAGLPLQPTSEAARFRRVRLDAPGEER